MLCVGAVAVAAISCSDDDESAPTTTQAVVTTTSPPARSNDGVLVLGVLLPTTGPGATLFGEGMVDAVELATEQINHAGGVIGSEVTLIERR